MTRSIIRTPIRRLALLPILAVLVIIVSPVQSSDAATDFCLSMAPLSVGASPHQVVVADFNNDGNLDLASANFNSNTVSISLGNGDSTFRLDPSLTMTIGGNPIGLAAADLDLDGNLDLAIITHTTQNLVIRMGRGEGIFDAPNPDFYSLPLVPEAVAAASIALGCERGPSFGRGGSQK